MKEGREGGTLLVGWLVGGWVVGGWWFDHMTVAVLCALSTFVLSNSTHAAARCCRAVAFGGLMELLRLPARSASLPPCCRLLLCLIVHLQLDDLVLCLRSRQFRLLSGLLPNVRRVGGNALVLVLRFGLSVRPVTRFQHTHTHTHTHTHIP